MCVCVMCWRIVIAASAPWTHLRLRAQAQRQLNKLQPRSPGAAELLVGSSACNEGSAEQKWTELPGPRERMNAGLGVEGV